MSTILVPLDGSDLANRAIPLAVQMGEASDSGLVVIEAIEFPLGDIAAGTIEALEQGATQTVEEAATEIQTRTGRKPATIVRYGSPASVILGEAGNGDVAYIVMTTHGRTGLLRIVLGSVAEEVVRRSPVPVFLIPSRSTLTEVAHIRRALVALDGSDLAASVLDPVIDLARNLHAEVILTRVYPPPAPVEGAGTATAVAVTGAELEELASQAREYLSPIAGRLQSCGIQATVDFRIAQNTAEEILEAALSTNADCIALATHGRSGLDRLQHGSVAEAVLRLSTVPVMTFGREALKRLHQRAAA